MRSDYSGPRYFSRLWSLAKASVENLRERGIVDTWLRVGPNLAALGSYGDYCWFVRDTACSEKELARQARHDFGDSAPVFSVVVPLFNTPEPFLRDMVESVVGQSYARWQLCLADASDNEHTYVGQVCAEYAERGKRISYRKLQRNLGIAGNSNAAMEMATGDYVALLDHDDLLRPNALYEVACAVTEQGADFVYSDEAIFRSPDVGDIPHIHFKPDFAPDNLRSNNYICHLTVFKRALLAEAGWFRDGFEGSQDHDLVLRLTDAAQTIVHIPKVLYLWRSHPQSVAMTISAKPYAGESGRKAVREILASKGITARVESEKDFEAKYRCIYELVGMPKVSIVIPSCDRVDDLSSCLESIQGRSSYRNFEVIMVENNSRELRTFEYYEHAQRMWDNVRVVNWDGPFNWSAINNSAVREAATGDFVLLLNNDTRVISPDWLQEMLMFAQREDVGCVGAMLYYPNNTVQHAGIVLGAGSCPVNYVFRGLVRGQLGYAGKISYAQNMSAVTGSCMLLRREAWDKVGGCDESYRVSYGDIDLCMRLREAGFLVVWTPHAELYHAAGKGKRRKRPSEVRALAAVDEQRFKGRWVVNIAKGDPYYNPNLDDGYHVRRPRRGGR